jgi:CubicO group peptidase (beta-lactamase class C family)
MPGRLASLIVAGALALAAPALAQPAWSPADLKLDPARIDRTLDGFVRDGRIVGGEVLVWKDGAERHYHTAGLADRETPRPFSRDTLVQLFSMTKPVTGVALMQQWEQGKFGLDDPLSWYIPAFANVQVADGTNPDGTPRLRPPSRPIVIRDILRHTAGFTYGSGGDYPAKVWGELQPLARDHTLAQFVELMAQVPLIDDPGSRWSYSAAIDVQARLVEIFSGQPFDEYVRDHIFLPLGMKDSAWKRDRADIPRLAAIYEGERGSVLTRRPDEQWLDRNFAGHPMTEGGAGIVSTIDDYMRFARMLLGDGAVGDTRILKPATVKLIMTDQLDPRITERLWLPSKGNVGYGVNGAVRIGQPLTPQEDRGTVGEYIWDGASSVLFWVDPVNDLAVVFMTQRMPNDITLHHDLREAVYGADYLGPVAD